MVLNNWHDWVLGIGNLVLILCLIPSFRKRQYPALWSCFMTFAILVLFALIYVLLRLWLTAAVVAANSGCWLALGLLRARNGNRQV